MQVLDEISRSLGEFLLLPGLTTEECTPVGVDLSAPLVRHPAGQEAPLRAALPVCSAIMEAVSSPRLAAALAAAGGIGFIHQNQPAGSQADDVRRVKRQGTGFPGSGLHVKPTAALGEVTARLTAAGHDVAAVTSDGSPAGTFLGLIVLGDLQHEGQQPGLTAGARMRPAAGLVTAPPPACLPEADALLDDNPGIPALPVVGAGGQLISLALRRDRALRGQFASPGLDAGQRFLVGAGVNTRDYEDRVPALVEAGADLLCIDSSDGFSVWQQKTLEFTARKYGGQVHVGAGNVVDGRGFRYLAECGAAFVKVGVGGGSICITRSQKGIGRGQASALMDVVRERDAYARETGVYVPVCCDGGLLSDYHMAIALAMGADFIMLGRYFARTEESPSQLVEAGGRLYKEYWGEGSQRARNAARYGQQEEGIAFPEGVDGLVPYAGSLFDNVAATAAKLRATMVSCGATTLRAFHESAVLTVVSPASYAQNTAEVLVREGGAAS